MQTSKFLTTSPTNTARALITPTPLRIRRTATQVKCQSLPHTEIFTTLSSTVSPPLAAATVATTETTAASLHPTTIQTLYELAALDSSSAGVLILILKPVLSIFTLLFMVRIIMTWYPEIDVTKFPFSLAYTPTEPLLGPTRKVIKPFNGLDISPIVWVALISFLSEILTGPQGILNLVARKGI